MLPLWASVDLAAMAMKVFSFILWHINLRGVFNAKAILLEEQQWSYLTHCWEDKGVRTFPNGICPKAIVITRVEFELAYYDSAVQCFNRCTTRTPPGNEEVLCIAQCSSITGTSPSDGLASYPEHSSWGGLTPLQKSSWCILSLQPTGFM